MEFNAIDTRVFARVILWNSPIDHSTEHFHVCIWSNPFFYLFVLCFRLALMMCSILKFLFLREKNWNQRYLCSHQSSTMNIGSPANPMGILHLFKQNG